MEPRECPKRQSQNKMAHVLVPSSASSLGDGENEKKKKKKKKKKQKKQKMRSLGQDSYSPSGDWLWLS
ncbi:unnamed protein product [Dibothriocephalus latus]|uniref:Uncharacterized protein n=1 Tax=Dibothriocephalus latus TaxID=60516 RepID=A0A3P6TRS2_DIBLA|nr:unnamed protein product [Dibothriocephalus latus]